MKIISPHENLCPIAFDFFDNFIFYILENNELHCASVAKPEKTVPIFKIDGLLVEEMSFYYGRIVFKTQAFSDISYITDLPLLEPCRTIIPFRYAGHCLTVEIENAVEELTQRIITRYLDNICASCAGVKILNPYTGEKEDPDNGFMQVIESLIQIHNISDFRKSLFCFLNTVDNAKEVLLRSNFDLMLAIKRYAWYGTPYRISFHDGNLWYRHSAENQIATIAAKCRAYCPNQKYPWIIEHHDNFLKVTDRDHNEISLMLLNSGRRVVDSATSKGYALVNVSAKEGQNDLYCFDCFSGKANYFENFAHSKITISNNGEVLIGWDEGQSVLTFYDFPSMVKKRTIDLEMPLKSVKFAIDDMTIWILPSVFQQMIILDND